MEKVLVICCSDVLGIPAIIKLQQQNVLSAIATTDNAAPRLMPILKNAGIADDEVHILTKQNLENDLLNLITQYHIDTLITLTFSWMVPDAVLNILPDSCINFHFGLLPKYAGADPIFWQINNAEPQGGISIHAMTNEIDRGPLFFNETLPIMPGENYGLQMQRLGMLAAEAVVKLKNMLNGDKPQLSLIAAEPALFFKKPSQNQLTINWQQQSATQIECLVNASNPRYEGAITVFRHMPVKILEVAPADVNNPDNTQFTPGTIIHADLLYGIIVACINNEFLKINVVHVQEGYFSGSKLFSLGFAPGEVFGA